MVMVKIMMTCNYSIYIQCDLYKYISKIPVYYIRIRRNPLESTGLRSEELELNWNFRILGGISGIHWSPTGIGGGVSTTDTSTTSEPPHTILLLSTHPHVYFVFPTNQPPTTLRPSRPHPRTRHLASLAKIQISSSKCSRRTT